MSRSGYIQRKLNTHDYCRNLQAPSMAQALSLAPLQSLCYANNGQMVMYRNGMFMNAATAAPFQKGEVDPNVLTWGVFDTKTV